MASPSPVAYVSLGVAAVAPRGGDRRRRLALQPGVRARPPGRLRRDRGHACPARRLDPRSDRRGRGHRRRPGRAVRPSGAARRPPAHHRQRLRARRAPERPERRRHDRRLGPGDRLRDAARCRYPVGDDRRPPRLDRRDPTRMADPRSSGRSSWPASRPVSRRRSWPSWPLWCSPSRWSWAASAGSSSSSRRSSRSPRPASSRYELVGTPAQYPIPLPAVHWDATLLLYLAPALAGGDRRHRLREPPEAGEAHMGPDPAAADRPNGPRRCPGRTRRHLAAPGPGHRHGNDEGPVRRSDDPPGHAARPRDRRDDPHPVEPGCWLRRRGHRPLDADRLDARGGRRERW